MTGDNLFHKELSSETIKELRERHKKEQEEASQGDNFSLSEAINSAGKELGERGIMEASSETQQFIEEEGRMFSDKLIVLIKLSAPLFEECEKAANSILRDERPEIFGEEDAKNARELISALALKYEDLLDRKKEFPAALEMIGELRKNIPGFVKKKSNPIFAYLDIARRVAVFHHEIGVKEGKSEYAIENFHRFMDRVNIFILQRIPNEAIPDQLLELFRQGPAQREEDKKRGILNIDLPVDPALASRMRNMIVKNFSSGNAIKGKFQIEDFSFTEGVIVGYLSEKQADIETASKEINLSIHSKENSSVSLHCKIKTPQDQEKIIGKIKKISSDQWEKFLSDIEGALQK